MSCSNKLHIFQNYKPYSENFQCSVQLNAAIKQGDNDSNASIVPEDEGYLLIPASNSDGYIQVKAFYSPPLTSTLIGENSIMGETKNKRSQFKSQVIHLNDSNFTLTCEHQHTQYKDIVIDIVLIDSQCFTHPLIIMDLEGHHQLATQDNSMDAAWESDTPLAKRIQAQPQHIADHISNHICYINTNAMYIKKRTEKLLWHQRFGHPCDEYLYKAGKAIKGVQTFSSVSMILDTCPTCIRAKQTKARKQPIKAAARNLEGSKPCASHSTKWAEHL